MWSPTSTGGEVLGAILEIRKPFFVLLWGKDIVHINQKFLTVLAKLFSHFHTHRSHCFKSLGKKLLNLFSLLIGQPIFGLYLLRNFGTFSTGSAGPALATNYPVP
jgi:hypothetical protein